MRKYLPILLVAALLSSCVPTQRFARATLNDQLGDAAVLQFLQDPQEGLSFEPGGAVALGTIVDVQADALASWDEALCDTSDYGIVCLLGDVADPVFIEVAGTNMTATATYRREGSNRVYHEIAVP